VLLPNPGQSQLEQAAVWYHPRGEGAGAAGMPWSPLAARDVVACGSSASTTVCSLRCSPVLDAVARRISIRDARLRDAAPAACRWQGE
jgi:hypothetical protein